MRSLIAAAVLGIIASSCAAIPESSVETPAPSPSPATITRPATNTQGDRPVLLRALPEAGAFVTSFHPVWRYDGHQQTLDFPVSPPDPLEHSAPAGGLVAIEHQSQTPGRYLVSTELAIRDRPGGPDRTLYQAPAIFYWSGWSPDGRYVAIWEVDFVSGSIDLDGRPLVVIDVTTGKRFDLGRTLLHGTTAWSAPHTLAFVAGFGREVSRDKTLRLWTPEDGIRDVSPIGTAALAPVWSADGGSLYFATGPAGQYDPLPFFTGRAIGDRHISVYDLASGTTRSLTHEPGYVEEGARPSRDGSRLLVLRRLTVDATDVRSIPNPPLEVWLTDGQGAHGTALVRIAQVGFGYYGWYPGPSEWDWSE
jgi:dipeptidyl aminopeptidase/acylaminoacyl peptidase